MWAYLCRQQVDQIRGLFDGLLLHPVLLDELLHQQLVGAPGLPQDPICAFADLVSEFVAGDRRPVLAAVVDEVDVVFEVHVVYPHL